MNLSKERKGLVDVLYCGVAEDFCSYGWVEDDGAGVGGVFGSLTSGIRSRG